MRIAIQHSKRLKLVDIPELIIQLTKKMLHIQGCLSEILSKMWSNTIGVRQQRLLRCAPVSPT